MFPHLKDPAVLKILRDSELLRRSVLLRPPYLLRCETLFEGKNAWKTEGNSVSAGWVAIVNHYAVANLLRIVYLLRRSIFSMAGSFGHFVGMRVVPAPSMCCVFWCVWRLPVEDVRLFCPKRPPSNRGQIIGAVRNLSKTQNLQNTEKIVWRLIFCLTVVFFPHQISLVVVFPQNKGLN